MLQVVGHALVVGRRLRCSQRSVLCRLLGSGRIAFVHVRGYQREFARGRLPRVPLNRAGLLQRLGSHQGCLSASQRAGCFCRGRVFQLVIASRPSPLCIEQADDQPLGGVELDCLLDGVDLCGRYSRMDLDRPHTVRPEVDPHVPRPANSGEVLFADRFVEPHIRARRLRLLACRHPVDEVFMLVAGIADKQVPSAAAVNHAPVRGEEGGPLHVVSGPETVHALP